MNIFRTHDFSLAFEDTDAAPVNHPALVNTNDKPSFSCVYFSPLTFAEALRASDISPVPSLKLQPNTLGGTERKIEFILQKIYWSNSEKENQTGH